MFLDSLVFYCQFAKSEMSKTESCQASQFVHLEVRIIDTMKIEILEKNLHFEVQNLHLSKHFTLQIT